MLDTEAMQEAEVDQEIDEGVVVGDGGAVAQMGSFDPQGNGLRINALDGSALVVDEFVGNGVTVEGVTQTRADGGGHHGGAAAVLPTLVMHRAGTGRWVRE